LIWQQLQEYWPTIVTLFTLGLSLMCSGHAILYKRDSRAATGWVGIIWLVPILGSILYILLGINTIKRLAKTVRKESHLVAGHENLHAATISELTREFHHRPSILTLARLGTNATKKPLFTGNEILPLINGDEAYPRMLEAIRSAEKSISLSTYIFDNDRVGKIFIGELAAAVKRGVEVRVLIDDLGLRYSWRPVHRRLKKDKIKVARFMGAFRPMTFPHFNLRKHRKILVVDGKIGFTGGMNIREGHQLSLNPKHPIKDLHFEVHGTIVTQLQEVFAEDWAFTTKELLDGPLWFSEEEPQGRILARVIADGPDEDLDRLPLIIEAAFTAAQSSIWIMTPYFLPDSSMVRALYIAALKGVEVNIVLPAQNNMPFVQWASNFQLLPLIQHGCHVWFSEPPFDHTKLILVDEIWSLFGSANLDPRSLRLNFELNVECYDRQLAARLKTIMADKLKGARRVSEAELKNRGMLLRLRDGFARLFSPYL
jgi:cardiolipin synthase A/B